MYTRWQYACIVIAAVLLLLVVFAVKAYAGSYDIAILPPWTCSDGDKIFANGFEP